MSRLPLGHGVSEDRGRLAQFLGSPAGDADLVRSVLVLHGTGDLVDSQYDIP